MDFLIDDMGISRYYLQNDKTYSMLIQNIRTNFKWNIDLNIKSEILLILGETHR